MMAWAGVDDGMPRHEKYMNRTEYAKLTFTHSILFCARELTDGKLTPAAQVIVFAEAGPNCLLHREEITCELLSAALWDDRGDGCLWVHDYLDWNPSREQVLARRDATRSRVTAFRERRKQDSNEGCNGVTVSVTNGVSNSSPLPLPLPLPESPSPTENGNTAEVTRGVRRRTSPASPNPANMATWEAYRAAYFAAYRVEPVRNGSVNGQVAKLVQRLGAEEAPKVAAWFVGHRGAWYVQQGHSVGALLRDCEKLHTEMCAGVRIHRRDVDEIDRSGADAALIARLDARHQERMRGNDAG